MLPSLEWPTAFAALIGSRYPALDLFKMTSVYLENIRISKQIWIQQPIRNLEVYYPHQNGVHDGN